MFEEDSVEYLRDLINEKDYLDKEEEHNVLKKLLTQGNKKLILSFKCPTYYSLNMLKK